MTELILLNKTLIIRRLVLEPGFNDFDLLVPELGRALRDLARFNGCETIVLENVRPEKLRVTLKEVSPLGMSG